MGVENRICVTCGKNVKGRSDKKFCDDFCRNSFNNQLKAGDNNFVRNVNNALRRNRRILQNIIPANDEMKKTRKEKLIEAGFNFKFHTHTYTNKKENTYLFCYEYGYHQLDHEWILVVKKKEE